MNLNKQGVWYSEGNEKTLIINNQSVTIISGFTENNLTNNVNFYKIKEIEGNQFYQI